jgi:surfeit locus 1 family protein
MVVRIGHWTFSPKLWSTIVTILIIPVFISLGFWQLDRAGQKRALHADYLERQASEVINLNHEKTIRNNMDDMLWRKIKAEGAFDETVQILLDNQVMNNQAGYFVYTPFQLINENIWFLVNRGWVATGNDRNLLPELRKTNVQVTITGSANNVLSSGISLGNAIDEQLTPGIYRLRSINIAHISDLVGKKLMPYVLNLDSESQHGYMRQWRMPGSGETVNLGYAFQWFAFAATLLIIYVVVNTKTKDDN